MADDIAVFHLQDHLQSLSDLQSYHIPNEHDIHTTDPTALLEHAVEAVAHSPENITDPQIFDIYRSILKYADGVPGSVMSKLLDSISSGLAAMVDVASGVGDGGEDWESSKTPLEMYAFLLQWFVSAAEKVKAPSEDEDVATGATPAPARVRKGRGGKSATTTRTPAAKKRDSWTWIDQIPATLALISKVLRLKTHRIWTTTPERDAFITYALSLFYILCPYR
jgi:condensin complex subunit 1